MHLVSVSTMFVATLFLYILKFISPCSSSRIYQQNHALHICRFHRLNCNSKWLKICPLENLDSMLFNSGEWLWTKASMPHSAFKCAYHFSKLFFLAANRNITLKVVEFLPIVVVFWFFHLLVNPYWSINHSSRHKQITTPSWQVQCLIGYMYTYCMLLVQHCMLSLYAGKQTEMKWDSQMLE